MTSAVDLRTRVGWFRLIAMAEAVSWVGLLVGQPDVAAAYFWEAFHMRDAEVAPFAALALACEIGRSGYGPTGADESAVALSPVDVEWLLRQALEYDHPEASPQAAFMLGELLRKRGQYPPARQYLTLVRDQSGHPEWGPKAAHALRLFDDDRTPVELARGPEVIEPEANSPFARNVLVVGAGTGGQYLFASLQRGTVARRYRVIGFLDDEPYSDGIPFVPEKRVLGPISELRSVVERHSPDLVWMAIPTAPPSKRRQVVELCDAARIPLKILPTMHELVRKTPLFPQLREVRIDDLLGDEQLEVRFDAAWWLGARRVMIVGGGGALGAALARKVSDVGADRIVLVDRDLHALRVIRHELVHARGYRSVHVHQGSAVAADLLHDVLRRHACDTVLFAVGGWSAGNIEPERQRYIVRGVTSLMDQLTGDLPLLERFVWLSDASIAMPNTAGRALGAVLEALVLGPHPEGGPVRCAIRVPRLYTSSGSMLADLREQLKVGGPLCVPPPPASQRYLHAYHAADLVLRAAEAAHHHQLFAVDCGDEVSLAHVAKEIVRLKGLEPREDIAIAEDPSMVIEEAPRPVGEPTAIPGVCSLGAPYADVDIRVHRAALLARDVNELIALAQRYCADPSYVSSLHRKVQGSRATLARLADGE